MALTPGFGPPDTPPLHFARPAFWFGHSMLATQEPARLTTTARTRCWVARIPGPHARELLAGSPEGWLQLLRLVGLYGDMAAIVAADLAIRGSERRLVAVLLRLSGHRYRAAGPPLQVVPINQSELAAACNLSRNTANTIIRRLGA